MITDSAIRSAIRAGKNRSLKDGTGRGSGRLVLLVRPMPDRMLSEWYVQQWLHGRRRLSKIGAYPSMSLSDARRAFVDRFSDAIQSRQSIKSAIASAGSLNDLIVGYIEHLQAEGRPSWPDVDRGLKRFLEFTGDKHANAVTLDDVLEFLRPVFASGAKSMADHLRSYIHSAYGWAMASESDYRTDVKRRFFIQVNPAGSIPVEKPNPGNRWLTPDELRTFWLWLRDDRAPADRSNRDALRLLAITGQRSKEIATIRSDMILKDLRCIDWGKTKNGRPHLLPLTEEGFRIVSEAEAVDGWLFPSVRAGGPLNVRVMNDVTQRYVEVTGAKRFTPRDLRRTWKTLAGQAGISKADRDRLQNHAKSDVSSVHYDRYDYLQEKRAAVDVWSAWWRTHIVKDC